MGAQVLVQWVPECVHMCARVRAMHKNYELSNFDSLNWPTSILEFVAIAL